MNEALGMIETRGLVAAIEAARNDGEDISAENQEVEWFYNLFIKFLDEFIEVFSA